MSTRTWDTIHRRGEVLRAVVETTNERRDGVLPMELPGVAETFGDELSLVAALQLRWHTRLAGRIEAALMDQPMDLEDAVVAAWRGTAEELPGIRMVIDAATAHPTTQEMAEALETASRKDWVLLAAMSGKAAPGDAGAARVGRAIEQRARALYRPTHAAPRPRSTDSATRADSVKDQLRGRLTRLKAHLAA